MLSSSCTLRSQADSLRPPLSLCLRVASLPLPLLIALIYRITVLHAASRIIIFIRRRTTAWEDLRSSVDAGSGADGERDKGGIKLSDEPPVRVPFRPPSCTSRADAD